MCVWFKPLIKEKRVMGLFKLPSRFLMSKSGLCISAGTGVLEGGLRE